MLLQMKKIKFPLMREVNCTTDLVANVTLVSRAPHHLPLSQNNEL